MASEDVLGKVKSLIAQETLNEDLLRTIIDLTTDRLKNLLGSDEIPPELAYIIPEVSVIRFNRVGSEGVKTHSVGGESMAFLSSDFDAYASDIQAWKDKQGTIGVVYFL